MNKRRIKAYLASGLLISSMFVSSLGYAKELTNTGGTSTGGVIKGDSTIVPAVKITISTDSITFGDNNKISPLTPSYTQNEDLVVSTWSNASYRVYAAPTSDAIYGASYNAETNPYAKMPIEQLEIKVDSIVKDGTTYDLEAGELAPNGITVTSDFVKMKKAATTNPADQVQLATTSIPTDRVDYKLTVKLNTMWTAVPDQYSVNIGFGVSQL